LVLGGLELLSLLKICLGLRLVLLEVVLGLKLWLGSVQLSTLGL
jgi:hypothetical protein